MNSINSVKDTVIFSEAEKLDIIKYANKLKELEAWGKESNCTFNKLDSHPSSWFLDSALKIIGIGIFIEYYRNKIQGFLPLEYISPKERHAITAKATSVFLTQILKTVGKGLKKDSKFPAFVRQIWVDEIRKQVNEYKKMNENL